MDARAADTDFWNDRERAEALLRERGALVAPVEGWNQLDRERSEIEILGELAEEEGDEATLNEALGKTDALAEALKQAEFQRMLSGETDPNNAIVTINAGAGGTEAQDWSEMLLRMYLRWAERRSFKAEVMDVQAGDEAGIKSSAFTVQGAYAYGYLKSESGVHRLVRISPFDANARRHTSFASVFVSPEIDDNIKLEINESDLRIDTYRSSGAGGQHVNKTDSAVRMTHLPTGIVVSCQNERSQQKNRKMAMKILRSRLYELELQKKQVVIDQQLSEQRDIEWGSQIRSYVLQPYQKVKDHRTGHEEGNVTGILDGDLDRLMQAYLLSR
ncbi:MAG: peptide chain release factor 2 [Deltaproteobacteria bacterium RBG_13_65_10]|nr:MAG: peptide chain release factor 2 [Deltaproteobacteria bacterium RBG_13_65_10]